MFIYHVEGLYVTKKFVIYAPLRSLLLFSYSNFAGTHSVGSVNLRVHCPSHELGISEASSLSGAFVLARARSALHMFPGRQIRQSPVPLALLRQRGRLTNFTMAKPDVNTTLPIPV